MQQKFVPAILYIKDDEMDKHQNRRMSTSPSEKSRSILIGILAIIVIAWLNNGIFTYAMPVIPNYIRYAFYFAWLGLALISNKKFISIIITQSWPILLFFVYMIYISFFAETSITGNIMSIMYLIMVYTIFLYYFNNRYELITKILCGFIMADFLIIGINTYFQLQTNPAIARYLATGGGYREIISGEVLYFGIGSYGYFYSLVGIVLLLSFLFLYQRNYRLFLLILLVLALTLIIEASFVIAIIFAFAFIILQIILRYSYNNNFVYIAILSILLIIILQMDIAITVKQISNIDRLPHVVSEKLYDISVYLSYEDFADTQVEGRSRRYFQSIEAFTNNVLTGTVASYDNKYSSGGHSAWFDLLANFGLFATPFFVFLYKSYKYIEKRVPTKFKSFVKVYWLYFVCVGVVNTLLFAPIYITWFLFLPLFIVVFFKDKSMAAKDNNKAYERSYNEHIVDY